MSNTNFELFDTAGKPIKAWTKGVPVEEAAKKQLKNISGLPFIFKHIAVMPDVHLGFGATVGSVIATKGAIIPAAVGVDIGCGMMARQTNLKASDLPDSLNALRLELEAVIPNGFNAHKEVYTKGNWDDPSEEILRQFEPLQVEYQMIVEKHPKIQSNNALNQLGTLGGGNHFVELCLDEHQNVWVMLHSGSRGAGNRIGQYFIEKAKEEMQKFFINLPDQDLAYIPEGSQYYEDYMQALDWAQRYAKANRKAMMHNVMKVLTKNFPHLKLGEVAVNCHHNYVEKENHFGENVLVTRKGAVRARLGDLGIIPGSMGAKSFIVRGKGNQEAFCSCSHGAGRVMSRTEAQKTFTVADHIRDTSGVECRKDKDVIDETPKAYKNIEDVMRAQDSLVEVVYTLKQVLCIKG